MKKRKKITSILIISALLFCFSVVHFNANALFVEGAYTFEEIDSDYVSLFAFDNSSEILTIPAMYSNTHYVSSISDYAFENNTTITAVDFSQNNRLSKIGMKAFVGCGSLQGDLTLPKSVRTIELGAFEKCTSIQSVYINSSVKTIPVQCFNRCDSLKEVYLPVNVEVIDNLAFANCPSLRDVYFPTTVNSISDTAFLNSNSVCFHVYYGSYAYQYAKDNNIRYTLIDEEKLGDVDGDGSVSINDVTQIQRHLAELESLEGIYLYAADANRDEVVDISDATTIQMFLAEYMIPYPIGETITQ